MSTNYANYQVVANAYNGYSPSAVHTQNNELFQYFFRELLQDLQSVYKINIPEHWDYDYFINTLFLYGFVIVFDSGKFGVIPQHGTLAYYNVFYKPSKAIVTNPLLITYNLDIGINCELIKIHNDYTSMYDMLAYYADMLALTAEALGINLINSKLSYVFLGKNKASAETLKALYDRVQNGNPAVFADSRLFNKDGTPLWDSFFQNLSQNMIGNEFIKLHASILNQFRTDVGIPNANFDKTDRALTGEINANNMQTTSKAIVTCENIKRGIEKVKKMFPELTDLSCDLRFEYTDNESMHASNQDKEMEVNGNE